MISSIDLVATFDGITNAKSWWQLGEYLDLTFRAFVCVSVKSPFRPNEDRFLLTTCLQT